MLKYRPDVDGLRAVAVTSVVAYHAHEASLPGGFTGVDIFFVISGYLITSLIASDIARQSFSIAHFYVRRAKRILPALFAVLVACWLLGLWLLLPSELSGLGRTMASTAAFASNIVFWQDTGYFDITAERKPLLHTWSLAVEEQFYVIWPIGLLLAARFGLRIRPALMLLMAGSFALSAYAVLRHPPSAFFLLPARAWELLLGAALALGVFRFPARQGSRNACAIAGVAMIAAGVMFLNRESYFPGWNALLPCLGAALLIAAGETGPNVVAVHLLARKPVVFVGLISYSLYLWHWPLLSFARITQRGALSASQAALLIAAAFVLSVLTWRFVERPFRAKSTAANAPVLWRYAIASLVVCLAGLATMRSGGFFVVAPAEIQRIEAARFDVNPLTGPCLRWQSDTGPLPGLRCVVGADSFARRAVLWGDSHADSAAPGIARWAAERGVATYQLTMAGCPPLFDVLVQGPRASYAPCDEFRERVRTYLLNEPSVETVILSARWTVYTENARFGIDDPGPVSYLVDTRGGEWSPAASKRAFSHALEATIAELHRSGKNVIVLGTIPPIGTNVPDCLARNHMPLSGSVDCNPPAAGILPHMAFADAEVLRLTADSKGVCGFIPSRSLCSSGRCMTTEADEVLYANDDHLSRAGAIHLSRFFDFDRCLSGEGSKPVLRHGEQR